MNHDFLTPEELSALVRVRPSTIREWARQGKIPAIRLSGTVIRFNYDEVREALLDVSAKEAVR